MSMRDRRYRFAKNYYDEHMAAYEKRRRSIWFRIRFFFRYSGLQALLIENRASLFTFGNWGDSNFAHGNVLFKAHWLAIRSVATGSDAWSAVEADPDAIAFILICPSCGYVHIMMGKVFFSFQDYDGLYRSSWFEIFNPRIWDQSGNKMVCQSCRREGVPVIQRFPHNPSAKPIHPGNLEDPTYEDPRRPNLPG
jgi:hypothetical protein